MKAVLCAFVSTAGGVRSQFWGNSWLVGLPDKWVLVPTCPVTAFIRSWLALGWKWPWVFQTRRSC